MQCGYLNGKEIQKGEYNVYVWMTHFAVQWELTQHYQATILR